MLGFMMLVFLMWAHADRVGTVNRGWLEAVRTSSFESLVAAPAADRGAAGLDRGAAGPDRGVAGPDPAQAPAAASPGARAGSAAAEPTPAVAGGRGTIDDDEHLDAYNAYLARLNQPGSGPGR
jgi:hypothetical protein